MTKPAELSTHDAYLSLEGMEGIPFVPTADAVRPPWWMRARVRAMDIYPGLLAMLTIAAAATWLSQHYGAPVMLFALLLGMAFHFLYEETNCRAGIEFAARTVLRLGVALLGARITLEQAASLGPVPLATVAVGVTATIAFGAVLSRSLGTGKYFGVLSGGAVAICGASAALAISSVLPPAAEKERDTVLVVVVITALSTIAMVVYPMLVPIIGLDHWHAGVFLGGTIHDVAQVVGAGFTVSPETGEIATVVKLLRVAMLLPVTVVLLWTLGRKEAEHGFELRRVLPLFLLGFVALLLANSAGLLSAKVSGGMSDISRWCLVVAIAALGSKTSFKALAVAGWRPVTILIAETVFIAALVIAAVRLLM
jgi:uncharacterized integral membrane protein (TIGR00698 family)